MIRDTYHDDKTRISKSGLDLVSISPLHYWQAHLAPPDQRVIKRSKDFDLGIALHIMVFEFDDWPNRHAIKPEVDMRTKYGREKMMEFSDEHAGKVLIKSKELVTVQRMRDALFRHKNARSALTGKMLTEHVVKWEDSTTGAPCKCRFDCINLTKGVAPDLKSTADASPAAFAKSMANFRYHVQNAFYMDGYFESGDFMDALDMDFLFIAVEKEPPYSVEIYQLEQEDVDFGRAVYRRDLKRYMEARTSNKWPSYSDGGINAISLPKWAKF